MKILIKSRSEIEAISQTHFQAHTALISISDTDCAFATLTNQPEYLLQVAFDDIDNDVFVDELGRKPSEEERLALETKYNMLTDTQAQQIASFYFDHKDAISTLICQCEHGQSRSAAVAAAILEFRSRRGVVIFSHDNYYPNKVVFRKVLAALKDCIPVFSANSVDLRNGSNSR